MTRGVAAEPLDPWRADLAARISAMLHRHVLAPWFPRIVDREHGGFYTDYDRAWRRIGPDDRMLEYQARQMRSAARLGRAFPERLELAGYAVHGMGYLADAFHDTSDGGWFWLIGRDGTPRANGTKHAHSTAYVITGLVEAFHVTGDEAALDMAEEAFRWLDGTLHDDVHGGYHGWATREGRPILKLSDAGPWPRDTDPLGHEVGLKDANVHSDLLESFRLLGSARPSDRLRTRAAELFDIVDGHFFDPDGRMHYLLRPDLSPFEGPAHPGYAFQCAFRMPLLAPLTGKPPAGALALARRAVDHALAVGWSDRGVGMVEKLDAPRDRARTWWVQTEAIQALTFLEVCAIGSYRTRIDQLMTLIENDFLDNRHGGWHQVPRSDWSIVDVLLERRWPKAHRWKDMSHETDMSLSTLRMLRGLPPDAPLES